jgi:bifunctional DNA-binding transcriptional regulator/antitoxin component of YhaV-PrlF toxin-antitoxin module
MSSIKMSKDGQIALPLELREKHGFSQHTPIRIVETRSGLLLVPLTNQPMSKQLEQEIAAWQALSVASWDTTQ